MNETRMLVIPDKVTIPGFAAAKLPIYLRIRLLFDFTDAYLTANEIADSLQVHRVKVLDALKYLKNEGIKVESYKIPSNLPNPRKAYRVQPLSSIEQ